ncbi:MAG: hypothetical protein A2785_03320 [Candidatus Chisholmbacteria bacterium RIFCSPHIGHO2_01_FULL_49_18]|uniref:Uncharacterized protein n=1 Tax=Candidatus Chisholmbacteria bacterium RIFCSPHIGHO2_01_FULL_49_18 TaxID=1797590 RepID=A0A1G1VMZ2_9BACT|nr:MAG: hypothetical protein A2785_03320 [Candidatus Chisholmbacteria bacterium RIFCSPHIGHO2_01_FULL_49_18]
MNETIIARKQEPTGDQHEPDQEDLMDRVTVLLNDVHPVPYSRLETRKNLEYYILLPFTLCGRNITAIGGSPQVGRVSIVRRFLRNEREQLRPAVVQGNGEFDFETRISVYIPLDDIEAATQRLSMRYDQPPQTSFVFTFEPEPEERFPYNSSHDSTREEILEYLALLKRPRLPTLPKK